MKITVVHDYPIHYKDLLFTCLSKLEPGLEVVYFASQSCLRKEHVDIAEREYSAKVAFTGNIESVPWLVLVNSVWKFLTTRHPDLVVSHGYHLPGCWAAWAWANLKRKPFILWYETNKFDHRRVWWKEAVKRLFIRHCAGAHTFGLSSAAYLTDLGLASSKIVITGAVVDAERFWTPARADYSPPGERKFIFVGRLSWEKNLGLLLASFHQMVVSGRKVRLTIVGSGPSENVLRKTCTKLGLDQQVEFRGYIPQRSLPAVMRAHDCLVLPSTYEPWGLVAAEAMLCRLPVIVSQHCGCAADLIASDTGWSFPPSDETALVQCLTKASEMPTPALQKMGDSAFAVAKQFSPSRVAANISSSFAHFKSAGSVSNSDVPTSSVSQKI